MKHLEGWKVMKPQRQRAGVEQHFHISKLWIFIVYIPFRMHYLLPLFHFLAAIAAQDMAMSVR